MKKLLALLLSMSMLIMCAPGISLVASAEEETITIDDIEVDNGVYIIDTPEKFLAIFGKDGALNSTLVDGTKTKNSFRQDADLTLATYTPSAVYFRGTYDGNGKTITIKNYVSTGESTQGLVCNLYGTIKNLTLNANIDIVTNGDLSTVGGIAGYVSGGTVDNCKVNGEIKGKSAVGGIVGKLQSGTIKNCINTAVVYARTYDAGGVVGTSAGDSAHVITNCANYGAVSANSTSSSATYKKAGGIVGTAANDTVISYCFNAGPVSNGESGSALTHAGAIAGSVTSTEDNPVSIENCFNTGTISAVTATGIIASNSGDYTTITNVYDISVSTQLSAVVADETAVKEAKNILILGLNGTTSDTIISAYAENEAYECTEGDGYDFPNFEITEDITVAYDSAIGGVFEAAIENGSEAFPYLIGNEADFEAVFGVDGTDTDKLTAEAYFKQTEDIVLYNYTPYNAEFNGVYDGNGYTITIASYVSTSEANQGLMRKLSGTIKNLTVAGEIDATDNQSNVGGFVGQLTSTKLEDETIKRGTIENCVNEASLKGHSQVGGIVGTSYGGTIKNCINKGIITGTNSYVGGILGASGNSSYSSVCSTEIINCGNYGTILGTREGVRYSNGGLVGGYLRGHMDIEKSFNAGKIKASKGSGGALIGTFSGQYAATVNITDCFNVGKIEGTASGESVMMGNIALPTKARTTDLTVTNFYDIAVEELPLLPENLVTQAISDTVTYKVNKVTTNCLVLSDGVTADDIITAYSGNEEYECTAGDGYDYPNFKATDAVKVVYDPGLKIDINVAENTPIFLSSDDTDNTVVRTTDTNEVITTAYAVMVAKFSGIDLSEYAGVEYGALISKHYSGKNLTAATATEKAKGIKYVISNEGLNSFGILIYGENMVAGDEYYVRPFVKYAGEYYYGTGAKFVLPELAE